MHIVQQTAEMPWLRSFCFLNEWMLLQRFGAKVQCAGFAEGIYFQR